MRPCLRCLLPPECAWLRDFLPACHYKTTWPSHLHFEQHFWSVLKIQCWFYSYLQLGVKKLKLSTPIISILAIYWESSRKGSLRYSKTRLRKTSSKPSLLREQCWYLAGNVPNNIKKNQVSVFQNDASGHSVHHVPNSSSQHVILSPLRLLTCYQHQCCRGILEPSVTRLAFSALHSSLWGFFFFNNLWFCSLGQP